MCFFSCFIKDYCIVFFTNGGSQYFCKVITGFIFKIQNLSLYSLYSFPIQIFIFEQNFSFSCFAQFYLKVLFHSLSKQSFELILSFTLSTCMRSFFCFLFFCFLFLQNIYAMPEMSYITNYMPLITSRDRFFPIWFFFM